MTKESARNGLSWRDRSGALLAASLMLAAIWSPLLDVPTADSFPISSFPMFSRKRPSVAHISHAMGVRADGSREVLKPSDIGSSEVLQAKVIIDRTVQQGRRASRRLCRDIATRVQDRYVKVEIRTDSFRVLPYFDGDRQPQRTQVHARCKSTGAKP